VGKSRERRPTTCRCVHRHWLGQYVVGGKPDSPKAPRPQPPRRCSPQPKTPQQPGATQTAGGQAGRTHSPKSQNFHCSRASSSSTENSEYIYLFFFFFFPPTLLYVNTRAVSRGLATPNISIFPHHHSCLIIKYSDRTFFVQTSGCPKEGRHEAQQGGGEAVKVATRYLHDYLHDSPALAAHQW